MFNLAKTFSLYPIWDVFRRTKALSYCQTGLLPKAQGRPKGSALFLHQGQRLRTAKSYTPSVCSSYAPPPFRERPFNVMPRTADGPLWDILSTPPLLTRDRSIVTGIDASVYSSSMDALFRQWVLLGAIVAIKPMGCTRQEHIPHRCSSSTPRHPPNPSSRRRWSFLLFFTVIVCSESCVP